MQSGEGRQSMSRSRSRSQSRSRSRSPSARRHRSYSRSRSRSRSGRRHRSRSGSRNGYGGRRRRSRSRSYGGRSSGNRRHMGTRDDPEPCKCLGVFGLSLYTTERELTSIFEKYGPLEKVQVVLDAKTGKSRGFAFVYFENVKDATEARNEMTGIEVDGRRIRVDYSITKRPHTPTPGIYMGNTRGSDRSYGRGGSYRDRYRSPSPRYRQSSRRNRRDDYDRGYDRYERSPYSDRYGSKYERYYDRSRSRSYSPRRFRY